MKLKEIKEKLQKEIKERDNVCERCGRKIKALRTVDNARNPTYWAGCQHGGDWGHFTHGVPRGVYELAVNLVLDGGYDFALEKSGSFEYSFGEATKDACHIIQKIKRMENYKNPRYDLKYIREDFEKYLKTKD